MFKVDDVIVYGTQGVCRIEGMEEKTVGGTKKNYFVLKPVNDNGSTNSFGKRISPCPFDFAQG